MRKPTHHSFYVRRLRSALGAGTLCSMLVLLACTGKISPDGQASADRPDSARNGTNKYLPSAAEQPDDEHAGSAGDPSKPGAGADATDVNRVGIHRLNNTEYDNTVRDLLGVAETPATAFIADEKALGFDNIADALGMTEAQYEQYFQAAATLTDAVFADAKLRDRIVNCAPKSEGDTDCTASVVTAFGLRAFRRPLADEEVEKLVALASSATAQGEDFNSAIALVVRACLSSARFLYRVELDEAPASMAPHRLSDFELASRLSYLVWSTMPDDELLTLADAGVLHEDDTLLDQLDRLLQDTRSQRFVDGFAAQWLGLRALQSHQVEPTVFPEWTESLRSAMVNEGLAYFDEFLHRERSLSEFLSADVNFVDPELAALYDFEGDDFDPSTPTRVTSDARRGFLGLASFLTITSYAYRTAPTLRGKWVLENLLCEEIPPPPPNIPQLETDGANAASQMLNVRERLAEHRKNPQCASCHTILDPIGLGLESFDAIGRHRDSYAAGDAIDATGMLPSGESFDGLLELSALLAPDPRLTDCASEKLLTYALSRKLVASDEPYLAQIRERFAQDGGSVRALLEQIVLSDLFRFRRGEPAP